MKNLKNWGIGLIIAGVFTFIMGLISNGGELAGEYRSDILKDFAGFFPVIMAVCGLGCAVIGMYFISVDNKAIEQNRGKVIEKNNGTAIVEFVGGERKTIYTWNVPVTVGDIGIFSYKGNILIKFEKE